MRDVLQLRSHVLGAAGKQGGASAELELRPAVQNHINLAFSDLPDAKLRPLGRRHALKARGIVSVITQYLYILG